ncbi:MAG: endopeptidase La [Fusobacteriaceae bacterium]
MQDKNIELIRINDMVPDQLPIIPLITRPIFPNIMVPITFTGEDYIGVITKAQNENNGFLGLVYAEEFNEEHFLKSKMSEIGTSVKIHKINSVGENAIQVIVQGITRFKKTKTLSENEGELVWAVEHHREKEDVPSDEVKAYMLAIMGTLKEIFKLNPILQEELRLLMSHVTYDKPGILIDLISSMLKAEAKELEELLEEFSLENRCKKLLIMLKKELEISELQMKISREIDDKISTQQKEFFLREQLKLIKRELGLEQDEKDNELENIQKRLSEITLSPESKKVVEEQMQKLSLIDKNSPEFHVTRSYIQSIVELPWGVYSQDKIDIKKAKQILDKEHYGLEDVKNNILEFISTIVKTGNVSGSILCLVGPPGVGKTSIGKSIASSLDREFYRFSVGGMVDEAEIKGHRRTYVGAMPGKIIQALKRVGKSNPVIMIDEIDKIGNSFRGDPASALLEVLDPEQNRDFLDHYLDVRYDLSKILFVTTANQLDTIPKPLLDRMELIQLPGYVMEEKIEIANRHLIPKQLLENGMSKSEIVFNKKGIEYIIEKYAREAGVRNLEKAIRKVMRKVSLKIAEGETKKVQVNEKNVEQYLGLPLFSEEELYQKEMPGVTLGLAWTSMGGDTLYIEAISVSKVGEGFKQTGQLGEVMKESSEIAYSYVRSHICEYSKCPIDGKNFFENNKIHLHVPEGATPKDGPSAGITMALALYSLAVGKPVKKGLAMTGELTLTGKVLPIGGLKEKVIAARRVKVFELIVPKANKKDFEKLPEYLKKDIKVHYVDYFEDVIKSAF